MTEAEENDIGFRLGSNGVRDVLKAELAEAQAANVAMREALQAQMAQHGAPWVKEVAALLDRPIADRAALDALLLKEREAGERACLMLMARAIGRPDFALWNAKLDDAIDEFAHAKTAAAQARALELKRALDEALNAIDAVESEPGRGGGSMFAIDWRRGLELVRAQDEQAALRAFGARCIAVWTSGKAAPEAAAYHVDLAIRGETP